MFFQTSTGTSIKIIKKLTRGCKNCKPKALAVSNIMSLSYSHLFCVNNQTKMAVNAVSVKIVCSQPPLGSLLAKEGKEEEEATQAVWREC